jgi:hypothetical protein
MTTTLAATAALAQDKLDLTAEKSRASYAIGADIANSMKRQSFDLDTKALAAGLVVLRTTRPRSSKLAR